MDRGDQEQQPLRHRQPALHTGILHPAQGRFGQGVGHAPRVALTLGQGTAGGDAGGDAAVDGVTQPQDLVPLHLQAGDPLCLPAVGGDHLRQQPVIAVQLVGQPLLDRFASEIFLRQG